MKKFLFPYMFLIMAAAAAAAPLGTGFTYSGRLIYQNKPANGSFDLEVKLFDDATMGNQLPQTATVNGLNIVNGLFVTTLSFGSGVFQGDAYWLEIWARPSGNGPFQKLLPRQPVNPSPYALFAPMAESANTASSVSANAVGGAGLQNNSITENKLAFAVVKSVNGLSDHVSLVPGPNVTITNLGNTLTIAASGGGGSGWSLSGNGGTTPGTDFLGTTDISPLELKVFNRRALRLEYAINLSRTRASMNVIGGYQANVVSGGILGATISGGGYVDSITGDNINAVSASWGTIGGGADNTVSGLYGTIPGGTRNEAGGTGSFAAGQNAHATHHGSFVWGDGTQSASSTGDRKFEVLATGGAVFYTGGSNVRADSPYLTIKGSAGEEAYIGGDGAGGDVQLGSLNPNIANVALYNAGNGTWMNLLARDGTVRTLTITGGADLAEPFPVSQHEIPAGSVVVIDAEQPGKLKVSTEPYDTRVAGVISGAGGVRPGIQMSQQGALEGTENVALTGRVYVQADASQAAIQPGDLLTTSPTPGHAMKVTDPTRAQGAILGKAMSALREGKGLVLVLVTLQ